MLLTTQKQDFLKRLRCGRVRSVANDVQQCLKDEENQERIALFVLSGVCSVITNGDRVDLNAEDTYQLCCMCCEALEVENLSTNKYKFLCSLYHIIKYLLNKDSIETALKLSSFVFMTRSEVNDEAVCNVYYNCHYIFHQIVAAKTREYLGEKADLSVAVTVLIHSVKFLRCCIGKYLLHILDRVTNFVRGIKLTDDEHHLQIIQLQIEILELTCCKTPDRCVKMGNENIYRSYLSLLSSIIKSLFDLKLLLKAQDAVDKTVECIVTWTENETVSKNCSMFLRDVLHILFERPDDFASKLEACTRLFESLMLKYKDSKILSWTCVTLAHVLHSVSLYWTSQCSEQWNQHMSLKVQKAFICLIFTLSELLLTSQCVKCILPSGEDCPVNNDTVSSVNLLTIVINCVTSSVVNKSEGFTNIISDAKVALNKAIARLNVLKEADCPVWKNVWKRYGIKMYNLGIHCNSAGLIHDAKDVFLEFCWACIQFGEDPVSPEVETGMLGRVMIFLVQIYKDLKKYHGALRITAIGLVVLPNIKEKFTQQWAKIKNYALAEGYKDVEILTVYDVLMDDKVIQRLCPDIDFEAVNFQQLLIWEMEAYSLFSCTSWKSVQAAFDKFCVLSPDSSIRVKGLLAYLPSLWVHGSTNQCTEIVHVVKNIVKEIRTENGSGTMEREHLCLLGNLYYWVFLCQLKVTRLKREEEILSSNIILKNTQPEEEDNYDPLETCDVTPAYKNLNIENESRTLETLNKAVAYWSSSLQNGLSTVDVLPNIEVAAWLYELYGYVTQKIRAWCLYTKFAEALNNKEAKLLGLCHVLEWCTCGMSECKLLMAAEGIVVLLRLEDSEEFPSQLLLHKYCLARGRHCLRNRKFAEIGEYVEKLVAFTKQEDIKHFAQSILHVQTAFLISQCKCLPHTHIVTWPSKSNKHAFSEATFMYCKAMSLLKQEKMMPAENAQVLSLMLEVSLWLGQLTLELFWPREAHCFMKGDLILSQKLALATRTAQFLNVLAQVDAICNNVNDCQVKLHGMEALLQLESRFQTYDIASKNQKTVVGSELCHGLQQLTLERPVRLEESREIRRMPWRNASPCGSPNLRKIVFVLPSFVKHPSDCQCHMCNTPALQTLALNAVCIQAQVYSIQSEVKEALEFFDGGLQLFRQLMNKQHELIRKLSSEVHQLVVGQGDCGDCFHLMLHPLKLGYLQVASGYGDLLAACSSCAQAWRLNGEALQEVDELKLAHPHLAADLMDQAFCIEQSRNSRKYKEDCNLEIEETPRQVTAASLKTPLNTSSLSQCVHFPLSVSNVKTHNHTPIKIKPRKLMLPENENDDLGKENKPMASGKPATKTRIHAHAYKHQKPKIVIFSEDTPTTAKREVPPTIGSALAQKSGRTLQTKTSQKETCSRHRATNHESLSSVNQLLKIRIDGPGNSSNVHEVSVNKKEENALVRNVKALTPNVIATAESNSTCLSINDINSEVFETTEPLPAPERAGQLDRKPSTSEISCNMHAPVLKAPKSLRTYTRQNSKAQLQEKSQTSQQIMTEEAFVNRPKDDESVHKKDAGKPACSSRKCVKKTFHSSESARKTRDDGNHASASGPCKSSEKENSNEALITHMENLVLESEKDKCSNDDVEQASRRRISHKKTNKGSKFLFTPSRKTVGKEHNETIVVSSSPDEQLDICAKQSIKHPKKKKQNKWKENVIPSSTSEDETLVDLKSDTTNEEEGTLTKIKPEKAVSSSKKKRLPTRHPFILN